MKKSIYSLQPDLRQLLCAANQRYLAFISELDDPSSGIKAHEKPTAISRQPSARPVPG